MLCREEKSMHLGFFFFFVSYIYACTHDIMQCECAEHRNVTLWLMLKKFQSKHFHTKLFFSTINLLWNVSFSFPLPWCMRLWWWYVLDFGNIATLQHIGNMLTLIYRTSMLSWLWFSEPKKRTENVWKFKGVKIRPLWNFIITTHW